MWRLIKGHKTLPGDARGSYRGFGIWPLDQWFVLVYTPLKGGSLFLLALFKERKDWSRGWQTL